MATTSSTSVIGTASSAVSAAATAQQAQLGVASTSSINGREITITSNPLQLVAQAAANNAAAQSQASQSQFLLSRFMTPTLDESEQTTMERNRADRYAYTPPLLSSYILSWPYFL